MVTEGAFGMVVSRGSGDETRLCKVISEYPTKLISIERNNGECIKECFKELRLDCEDEARKHFLRCVDIHIHDECSSNLRAERACSWEVQHDTKFGSLQLLCDVHKRAQTLSGIFDSNKPLSTKLIRLSLSMKGTIRQHIRREARQLIRERLTIYVGSRPPLDADQHRQRVWDTFVSNPAPSHRYRRRVLESLFNGDLRKVDRIEHYEVGCCSSARETKKLLLTIGVEALFPRTEFKTLQTSNWIGSDASIDDVALPAFVHSIFQHSYQRCAGVVLKHVETHGACYTPNHPKPDRKHQTSVLFSNVSHSRLAFDFSAKRVRVKLMFRLHG
jgi:hypothetical protein